MVKLEGGVLPGAATGCHQRLEARGYIGQRILGANFGGVVAADVYWCSPPYRLQWHLFLFCDIDDLYILPPLMKSHSSLLPQSIMPAFNSPERRAGDSTAAADANVSFPPVTKDHILHCSYDYWFPK